MTMFKSSSKLHWIKNLYQRYTRGAGCCDLYNAYDYLGKKILPVLKKFRTHNNGYPVTLDDVGQWMTILDEMIWAFEYEESFDEPYDREKEMRDCNRQQFGLELFGMFFRRSVAMTCSACRKPLN